MPQCLCLSAARGLLAGKRQDNTVKLRRGNLNQKGARFFEDDEDDFGLEDILQVQMRHLQACLAGNWQLALPMSEIVWE